MADTLTVQNIVLDLLQYIGVTSLTPVSNSNALNRPGIITEDINKALVAINMTLGQVERYAPSDITTRTRLSVTLNAPTAVVLNATNESKTITFTSGAESWMKGCSIQLPGDQYLNQIFSLSGNNATLLRNYHGSTGSISGTVYGDAAILPQDTKAVLVPVEITPNRLLMPAANRTDFDRFSFQANSNSAPFTYISKTTGQPILYLAEPEYDSALKYMPIYLRVNPMPSERVDIIYVAERKFTKAVSANINAVTDPAVEFSGNIADWMETIFLPIARKNFSSHPAWKNREARAEVNDQYKLAMENLQSGTLAPQKAATRALYI